MSETGDSLVFILKAFRQRNQKELRKENDRLVKQAALQFSKPVYQLAVLSYVLSKIVSKPRFLHAEYAIRMREIEGRITDAMRKAERATEEQFLERIGAIERAVERLEVQDARFLRDLVSKGRLKVAATLYAQGISLGMASEMTGINKQDILDYAGQTMMSDRIKEEKTIYDRLKVARELIQ